MYLLSSYFILCVKLTYIYIHILLQDIKPVEKWIKPGVSVTSVEKKISKPYLSDTESDSKNNDDDNNDNSNDSDNNTMEVTENKNKNIRASEIDEAHNTQLHEKMEISESFMSPESKEINLLDEIITSEKD